MSDFSPSSSEIWRLLLSGYRQLADLDGLQYQLLNRFSEPQCSTVTPACSWSTAKFPYQSSFPIPPSCPGLTSLCLGHNLLLLFHPLQWNKQVPVIWILPGHPCYSQSHFSKSSDYVAIECRRGDNLLLGALWLFVHLLRLKLYTSDHGWIMILWGHSCYKCMM